MGSDLLLTAMVLKLVSFFCSKQLILMFSLMW